MLSGGNVDLGVLPGLIRRAETRAGRRLLVFAKITDRPGGLARLLAVISEERANVIEVEHVREGVDLHVRETGVRVAMEVRNRDHAERVLAAIRDAGYPVEEPGPDRLIGTGRRCGCRRKTGCGRLYGRGACTTAPG